MLTVTNFFKNNTFIKCKALLGAFDPPSQYHSRKTSGSKSMCNQMVDKTRVKLFPNFTSTPFDYLLISWVTNYVSNLGFLKCLS